MLIQGYFASRAERLALVTLEDLVANADPYALCLHRVGQVDELVGALLRETMRPFDETAWSDLMTGLRAQIGSGSDTALIRVLRDYSRVEHKFHGAALSRAMNRLSLHFLERFSPPDGSIDWEELARSAQHIQEQEKGGVPNGVGGG